MLNFFVVAYGRYGVLVMCLVILAAINMILSALFKVKWINPKIQQMSVVASVLLMIFYIGFGTIWYWICTNNVCPP